MNNSIHNMKVIYVFIKYNYYNIFEVTAHVDSTEA